jgi:chitinase
MIHEKTGSKKYSDTLPLIIAIFNSVNFINCVSVKGLDLDWEYPKCWQVDCSLGPDTDKAAFSDLVRELSAEFKPRGEHRS